MHARVTHTQIHLDKMDEAQKLYESLEPTLKGRNGFVAARLFTDRSSGKGISITTWDTEADMLSVESGGTYQEVIQQFASMFAAPPTTEHYEVAVRI